MADRRDPVDDIDSSNSGQELTDVRCDCGTWTAVTLYEAENSDGPIRCDVCERGFWRRLSESSMPDGWDWGGK